MTKQYNTSRDMVLKQYSLVSGCSRETKLLKMAPMFTVAPMGLSDWSKSGLIFSSFIRINGLGSAAGLLKGKSSDPHDRKISDQWAILS